MADRVRCNTRVDLGTARSHRAYNRFARLVRCSRINGVGIVAPTSNREVLERGKFFSYLWHPVETVKAVISDFTIRCRRRKVL